MGLPIPYSISSNMPFAGAELKSYLERLTGVPAGKEAGAFQYDVFSQGGSREGFGVAIGPGGVTIRAGSDRGAVYGVYAFLEDHLGCRFFAPDCEALPDPGEIRLKQGRYSYEPAFSYREAYWRGALDGRFALKLRLNSARADIPKEWGGKTMFYNYSHTFEELVPPKEWFASHPEYFSLTGGVRRGEKSQLCLTNPEVLHIVTEKVRQWMRENPDCRIFSVAQNDWYSPCQCEKCREVDEREGSHAGTMIAFVNAVADAVREEFPSNRIHTFAYLYTRKAPRFVRPRPNVIVRLCSIECCFSHPMEQCACAVDHIDVEAASAQPFTVTDGAFLRDLREWSAICPNLYIWDYTTNFSNYLQPFPNLHVLAPNLRLMRDRGVKGVFEQGNYAPGEASAFAQLKIYLLGKLMWDPELDPEALTAEFLRGYYGAPAAACLKQYLRLMETAAAQGHMGIFDGADAPYLTDSLLLKGAELMDRALKAAGDPVHRLRIRREELSVRYMRLVRLPLEHPFRNEEIDAFARDVQELGIQELFERRELAASFECIKRSRWAKDRSGVPYRTYRL